MTRKACEVEGVDEGQGFRSQVGASGSGPGVLGQCCHVVLRGGVPLTGDQSERQLRLQERWCSFLFRPRSVSKIVIF